MKDDRDSVTALVLEVHLATGVLARDAGVNLFDTAEDAGSPALSADALWSALHRDSAEG
jgi:hypothetical protein